MIRFNVPPFTGKEMDYMKQAVERMHICGVTLRRNAAGGLRSRPGQASAF